MDNKVLLVANTSWYLYNFRLPLARHLREIGFEVVFVAPRDAYSEKLESEDFRFVHLEMNRKGINPFSELLTLMRFWRIYRQEAPTFCHHFTIKCVLYGTVAAKLAGVRAVVNAITGLGHAFLGEGLVYALARPVLRFVYRKVLTARRVQVVFQNGDDYKEFLDRKMVTPGKTTIIRGSGICMHRFRPRPGALDGQPSPIVLLASRLIREKGLLEYAEAARILKSKGLEVRFALAGQIDDGNPSAISKKTLDEWIEEGLIDYLGHSDRVEDFIEQATLVVLPSYREGTPKILLEAAAMGKPLIASDVPGCREIVKHGYNGSLVPARDAVALAGEVERLLQSPELLRTYSENSRTLAGEFKDSNVIEQTIRVYGQARKGARRAP